MRASTWIWLVVSFCLLAAACRTRPPAIIIIGENGDTVKGRPVAGKPECAIPPGAVVVFRINSAQMVHMYGEALLGMAGTAYRVSGDCKAFEEIGKVDLKRTDDELAADFGVSGAALYTPDPAPGPVKIVKSFYEALNNGQIDAAMDLVDDDPRFEKKPLAAISAEGGVLGGVGVAVPAGAGVKEEVRNRIAELVDQAYTFELKDLRPGRRSATYAYRVFKEGEEVASGEGITRVRHGRIFEDRDLKCAPDGDCAPAVLFVSSRGMQLKQRTSGSPSECLISPGGAADGQKGAVGVGSGVAVVFRDAMRVPHGFVGAGDRARAGDIYQVSDDRFSSGCKLGFIGTAARGQSDGEILAAFGIGVSGGESVIPQGAPRKARASRLPSAALEANAIRKVWPEYPALAREMRMSGTVEVEVQIDEGGNVVAARILRGHPLFVEAAVKAARQWKFGPLLRQGRPAKTSGTLTFRFGHGR